MNDKKINIKEQIKNIDFDLNELEYQINNLINSKKNEISNIIINRHKEILVQISHLKYLVMYNYLNGSISKNKYIRNFRKIRLLSSKLSQEAIIILQRYNYGKKNNYITYLNENINKYDNYNLYLLLEKENVFLIENNQIIFININNIYDYLDILKFDTKHQIYLKLVKKNEKNYNKILKVINPIIAYKFKEYKYFINEYPFCYINKFKEIILKSNLIGEFIEYKKNILKKEKLLPIEVYSNNYLKNYKYCENDIYVSLSIYGEEIINLLYKQLRSNVFYNSTKTKGVSINDLSGNTIILMKKSYDLENIFVLSHELGHYIYNNCSKNKIITSKSLLFSEISAILNELFLYEYLRKNKKIKSTYFIDTIMKIITNGIIEYDLIQNIDLDKVNYDTLKNNYDLILNMIYNTNNITLNNNIDILIDRNIDNGSYILKYFIALITSICIYKNINKDISYLEKYKQFLKFSSEKSISEVFDDLNIDFTNKKTLTEIFNYLENLK